MPAFAVIGAQWGDEGKGKVIDYLAEGVSGVVRYAGGNNAGHTVVNDRGEFQLHLVPSGICWPDVYGIIGNGVVVDPQVLLSEVNELAERGIDTDKLCISERAHVIMPYHVLLDQLEEEARGDSAIGTTGRGIGPTYMDKTARARHSGRRPAGPGIPAAPPGASPVPQEQADYGGVRRRGPVH